MSDVDVFEVVVRVDPFFLDVIDDKSQIRWDPDGLDRTQINPYNMGRGVFVGHCGVSLAASGDGRFGTTRGFDGDYSTNSR